MKLAKNWILLTQNYDVKLFIVNKLDGFIKFISIRKFIKRLFTSKWERVHEETLDKISKEWEEIKGKEIIAYRDKSQEDNRNFVLSGFEIVKAIDLKPQDVIIHNYSKFKISECGCGFGAGNEFGDYFFIKGVFVNGNPTDPKPLKDFWSFQRCPMIKVC